MRQSNPPIRANASPTDGEIAAVEDRADSERVVDERMRRRRHERVVGANQRPARPVPVVEPIRAGDTDQPFARSEPPLDMLEPLKRHAAVGVHVREDVTGRKPPRRFPRDDEAFSRLFDDANARNRPRSSPGAVGAGVVDDDDFVRGSGLGEKRKETGRQQVGFVVGADDRGDRHAPRCPCR